jgi:hypothetical protein
LLKIVHPRRHTGKYLRLCELKFVNFRKKSIASTGPERRPQPPSRHCASAARQG